MFIFLRSDITQGLASLSRSASGSSPVFAYTVLAANVVSQLICVSSVNRLTSVSVFFPIYFCVLSFAVASIVGVNTYSLNCTESNQLMLQHVVVQQRLEHPTSCRCCYGIHGQFYVRDGRRQAETAIVLLMSAFRVILRGSMKQLSRRLASTPAAQRSQSQYPTTANINRSPEQRIDHV